MASPIFNLSDVELEVEAVDDETFELLGHATELGTLEYGNLHQLYNDDMIVCK